jgi:small multidrug resistance pump
MKTFLILLVAICAEVVATSALKAAEGFTRLIPSIVVVIGYGIAFSCLSLTLKTIPVGMAYAIWSGVGTALVALVAWIVYKQHLDLPAILGISLILAGTVIMNVFSKVSAH